MASKDSNSRMHKTKTDAFIQDYLSDIWGDTIAQNKVVSPEDNFIENNCLDENDVVSNPGAYKNALSTAAKQKNLKSREVKLKKNVSIKEKIISNHSPSLCLKRSEPISNQFSLVPTIKIVSNLELQLIRSQVEATIILLTNLYFLRRPLPPKVRQYILILSEQVIDDFNAAYWLQGHALKEAYHEV